MGVPGLKFQPSALQCCTETVRGDGASPDHAAMASLVRLPTLNDLRWPVHEIPV